MSLNKRYALGFLAAVLPMLLIPTPSLGQILGGPNSLSFSAGGLIGDTLADVTPLGTPGFDSVDVDDGFLFMFRFQHDLTGHIGLEIGTGGTTNDILDVGAALPGGEAEMDTGVYLLNGGVVFNVMGDRIVPFAALGAGLVRFSGEDAVGGISTEIEETDFSFNFGGGLKIYATDWFFFRADVRDHVTFPEDPNAFPAIDADTLHLIEISGGVGVSF